MDQRPKPRIWNGDEYDSDPDEDEKPQHADPNLETR
jgi:histone deacetylase 1/2